MFQSRHFKWMLAASLFLALASSPCSQAEVLVDEPFSGSASNPDWLWNMITGVGSVTFGSGLPGYAHYELDGPGSGNAYHNAELYQLIDRTPPFCDFEVRLRNSNNCGFDAPGWPQAPDPLYGMGSRGWGFWNFSTDPDATPINVIWFQCFSPESSEVFRGRRIWIVRDNTIVLTQELDIDLTQWHTYRIQWRPDYIGVFVDDMETPIAEVTDPGLIPQVAMTFTTWIDNYTLTGTNINDMSIGWMPVPDFQQFIDVDYIRISTASTISAALVCQPSSGVLPFNSVMTVMLDNEYLGQSRRVAARIDLDLDQGVRLNGWRQGTTTISAGGRFTTQWLQKFPAYPSMVGQNLFQLHTRDVTPAPYNQPPYPPSGDTAMSSCTVTGIAP